MSIIIPQPAMALNAEDAPGAHFKMWNSWEVPKSDAPSHIFGWTATVAKAASGGKLKAVVINCHGSPAYLSLGTGVGWGNMSSFSVL